MSKTDVTSLAVIIILDAITALVNYSSREFQSSFQGLFWSYNVTIDVERRRYKGGGIDSTWLGNNEDEPNNQHNLYVAPSTFTQPHLQQPPLNVANYRIDTGTSFKDLSDHGSNGEVD